MSDAAEQGPESSGPAKTAPGYATNRGFQQWATRVPLLNRFVRGEGQQIFDLMAGFCYSQVLQALVRLDILNRVGRRAQTAAQLSEATEIPLERMETLLQAGEALGLLRRRRSTWRLTSRGGIILTVPGLTQLVSHHEILYRDLSDPVQFFRGSTVPELAKFWPYVLGQGGEVDPGRTERYSRLMRDTLALVAEDTLDQVSLQNVKLLLDVGGGSGAFLEHAAARHDGDLALFDLPAVVEIARGRLAEAGIGDRVIYSPGNFTEDPVPGGADLITLIRVLYDHDDQTVLGILDNCLEALEPGGRIVISEPMAGSKAGDGYFALYCMAMTTGQVRSQRRIAEMLKEIGFGRIARPRSRRPFVTSVVTAVKPA